MAHRGREHRFEARGVGGGGGGDARELAEDAVAVEVAEAAAWPWFRAVQTTLLKLLPQMTCELHWLTVLTRYKLH